MLPPLAGEGSDGEGRMPKRTAKPASLARRRNAAQGGRERGKATLSLVFTATEKLPFSPPGSFNGCHPWHPPLRAAELLKTAILPSCSRCAGLSESWPRAFFTTSEPTARPRAPGLDRSNMSETYGRPYEKIRQRGECHPLIRSGNHLGGLAGTGHRHHAGPHAHADAGVVERRLVAEHDGQRTRHPRCGGGRDARRR